MKTTPQAPGLLFGPVLNDVTAPLPPSTILSFSALQIRRVNKEVIMDKGPREQGSPEQPGGNK